MGLLSEVVPKGTALERAREIARRFAAKSPIVMKIGRDAFMRAMDADYRRAIEVALAKNQQRSPQFAAEHAKHMAQMLRWLAARATASGHHGAAASHLVRLGKVDPLAAARGIYRFCMSMSGAGRKPPSTTRYQDMAW